MISKEEIQDLASLARLSLSTEEMASLQRDISSILDYVGQLASAEAASATPAARALRNVMRDDEPRTQDLLAGKREVLLNALPRREGDYAVVRKIIQKDE